jgi:hypothetical protein
VGVNERNYAAASKAKPKIPWTVEENPFRWMENKKVKKCRSHKDIVRNYQRWWWSEMFAGTYKSIEYS